MATGLTRDSHIGEFTPDPQNARKHNPKNVGMIERSLGRVGAGRSLVADRNGVILAGNATMDAAAAAGFEEVIVVPSDGTRLVVVQRTDLDASDPRAVELAIMDNRTAELAEWDTEQLASLRDSVGIEWDTMFTDKEWGSLTGETKPAAPDAAPQLGGLEYRVVVDVAGEVEQAKLIEELEGRGFNVKALIS